MDKDVIRRPPRRVQDPIVTKELVCRVILSASIIVSGTLFIFWREVSIFLVLSPAIDGSKKIFFPLTVDQSSNNALLFKD